MKRLVIITLLLLLTINTISATRIEGTVYSFSLEKLNNIIIEINTQPAQRQIATTGSYSFNVPPGTYTILAKTPENNVPQEYIVSSQLLMQGVTIPKSQPAASLLK